MHFVIRIYYLVFLASVCLIQPNIIFGQVNANNIGNGGIHTIRGRIYLPNGRPLGVSIKVELQSNTEPTQTSYSDQSGTFGFTGLLPGPYTVVIDAGESFEIAKEYFLIDKDVQIGVRTVPVPKILNSHIYLRAKRIDALRNEVLNAKWSAIPKDAIHHYKLGLGLMDSEKDAEAEAEFRTSASIAPNFAPAYTAIGMLHLKAKQFANAVVSFSQAIRYDATDFDACLNLGIAYFNLNKMAEAEAPLVNAAFLDSFSVKPHYYLGLIFSARNDGDVAQKAFEKVNELDGGKSFPVIHKYLGRIYMRKQMNKEAVAEFETYLKLLPNAKDTGAIRKEISDIKSRPTATKYAPA